MKAGKEFFRRLDDAATAGKSLIIESTLSGIGLAKRITYMKSPGYTVHIIYLFLKQPADCRSRIAIRVKKGGHHVPDADVERRFHRSLSNFNGVYRPLADTWQLMYNGYERPLEVAVCDGTNTEINDKGFLSFFMEKLL